jgi:electron transfer flavoprotein beta subunit
MKILVGIKRVVDYNVRVRVKPDGSGVALDGVKMSINPFDEIALEEALRIKERGQASEVIAVGLGPEDVQTQLRSALAMGADRAILVRCDGPVESRDVARTLLAVIKQEQVGLAILGKQAIDDDCGQTGQMLAALWERPQATFASKIEIKGEVALVTREVDAGLETLEIDLPAVVTTDLRLNEPRYIKLPDIMKAKKKPLAMTDMATLGVSVAPQFKVLKTEAPPQRSRGIMVKDAGELVAEMRKRGVIS